MYYQKEQMDFLTLTSMFDLLRIAFQSDGLTPFKKKTGFCVLAFNFAFSAGMCYEEHV